VVIIGLVLVVIVTVDVAVVVNIKFVVLMPFDVVEMSMEINSTKLLASDFVEIPIILIACTV
jgi:hypothetical protein